MSYVDELIDAYRRFVALPWPENLAAQQRVWMAVYPPEYERRLRLHLREFEFATKEAGHEWALIDITISFEEWMAKHDYRDEYFESPDLLESSLASFMDHLVSKVGGEIEAHGGQSEVVALVGAGALFGLGAPVKVSALVNGVSDRIRGRLLVFFPGENEGDRYRLLDARDGSNYLATAITPTASS